MHTKLGKFMDGSLVHAPMHNVGSIQGQRQFCVAAATVPRHADVATCGTADREKKERERRHALFASSPIFT